MEIWIIIGLPIAVIIFLLDYLLRKTKWNENTRGEKTSLILNMVSVVDEYSNIPQPVNNITVSSHIKHFFI